MVMSSTEQPTYLGIRAPVLVDWTQERPEHQLGSGTRMPSVGSSSLSLSVVTQEQEAHIEMVPAVTTKWTIMVAPKKNARVPPIRHLEAIAMREQDGKDAPAPMDGLQSRLATQDLVLMDIQITSTPAARVEAQPMEHVVSLFDILTRIVINIRVRM